MRRCTTVPGFGTCCRAAQAGALNRPIPINTPHGQRCGECRVITKRRGGQGFQFRFHKSSECGLMAGGCPALAAGGGGGQLPLPTLPGTF